MITIMGATGHTGHAAAEELLKAGQTVRVLARDASRLKDLVSLGAEPQTGSADDAAYLTRAFRGSDAVYTLLPPDVTHPDYTTHQNTMGEAIATAVRESGVRHVVLLSSIGADKPSGTGPIAGLHRQEKRLGAIPGLNLLALRSTYFFENHFASFGLIRHQGINGSAIRGDLAMPMIASRDVGHIAAHVLRTRDFTGISTRELLGPRDITFDEVTRIIGNAIGKPDLPYVTFPYEAALEGMMGAGLSRSMAELYVEMARGFNEGHIKSLEGRNARTTTPTRFEDFTTQVLAPLYRAQE